MIDLVNETPGRFIEVATERVPAAAKLLAHIREHYGSIPRFAEMHGFDRIKVQKAIRGQIQRMDVLFALDIQRATRGAVVMEEWVPEGGAR